MISANGDLVRVGKEKPPRVSRAAQARLFGRVENIGATVT